MLVIDRKEEDHWIVLRLRWCYILLFQHHQLAYIDDVGTIEMNDNSCQCYTKHNQPWARVWLCRQCSQPFGNTPVWWILSLSLEEVLCFWQNKWNLVFVVMLWKKYGKFWLFWCIDRRLSCKSDSDSDSIVAS